MDYLTRCKIAGYVIQQPINNQAIGSGSLMWRLGPENTKDQWVAPFLRDTYITEELGLAIVELCKENKRNDIINSLNHEKANKLYAGKLVAFLQSAPVILEQIPDRAISADWLTQSYKINANNNSTLEWLIKFTLADPPAADPDKTLAELIAETQKQERASIRQQLLKACPPNNWTNDWLNSILDRVLPSE